MRQCTRCKEYYPATLEYFYKGQSRRDGLSSGCKKCLAERGRAMAAQISEARRTRKINNPAKMRGQQLHQSMKTRAKKAGVPFDSDYMTPPLLEELLRSNKTCPCCNVELLQGYNPKGVVTATSPSFDRILPKLGYVRGNLALLCHRCNGLKSNMSIEDLERILKWLRSAVEALDF